MLFDHIDDVCHIHDVPFGYIDDVPFGHIDDVPFIIYMISF